MKEISPKKVTMDREDQEGGHYYRAIARHFFLKRGAPFHLSPRELEIIARWEAASIPLPVILEAIDRTVEKAKKKKRPFFAFSLLLCDGEVQRGYAQYRERLVGGTRRSAARDKHENILQAINSFLQNLPSNLNSLKPILIEAREIILTGDKKERERKLEALEEAMDKEIAAAAQAEERKEVKTWMEKEFAGVRGTEKEEIFQTALVKLMREKYRIPHLLTCYY